MTENHKEYEYEEIKCGDAIVTQAKDYLLPTGKVLILRTNDKNNRAYGGFQWPQQGLVEAPDWSSAAMCGRGLHGALWGVGDASLLKWDADAIWQVIEADESSVIDLGGKVKVPCAIVVHNGNRISSTSFIQEYTTGSLPVIGGTATAGNYGTATAGFKGTATAGDEGTATAGNYGTATAGNYGTATAGFKGTATAGNYGTATAGNYGTATAGNYGTATAGDEGVLIWRWWNGGRYEVTVVKINRENYMPNVGYKCTGGVIAEA